MVLNIEQDYLRFRQIVRGKIKQDLKKYISQGELIGKKGKDFVSIPIPQIELPNFRFGRRNTGGVGQGEGEPGTPLAPGDVDENGDGKAGNAPGAHILEVDLTMEELAQILAEELELPRIQPKGSAQLKTERDRYSQISKVGPESLRHFKRTYKEALKRQITAGTYDPLNPYIVPIHEDKRFLSWKTKQRPESNALILYMMDVSGSMGDEQKEIVRIDPEGFDPHDFFLLIAHRSRNVHHVQDQRIAFRTLLGFPREITFVFVDGNNIGIQRVVCAGRDLPLQRFLVRALEVPQPFRSDL